MPFLQATSALQGRFWAWQSAGASMWLMECKRLWLWHALSRALSQFQSAVPG